MEAGAEKDVQQEELRDDVDDVEGFDEQVEDYEVVAFAASAGAAGETR